MCTLLNVLFHYTLPYYIIFTTNLYRLTELHKLRFCGLVILLDEWVTVCVIALKGNQRCDSSWAKSLNRRCRCWSDGLYSWANQPLIHYSMCLSDISARRCLPVPCVGWNTFSRAKKECLECSMVVALLADKEAIWMDA